MLQLVKDLPEKLLEVMKVYGQPLLVEPLGCHGNGHAPVVAVQFLAIALITPQLMRRGKLGFYDKLVHGEK
jgi:hypothetical protein